MRQRARGEKKLSVCAIRVLMALLLLLSSSGAAARETKDEIEAREAVRRGVIAAARGDFDVALIEYKHAQLLAPGANAPYLYAAEAFVAKGLLAEAIDSYEKYLVIKPDVSDGPAVRTKIEDLRKRLPGRLVLTLQPVAKHLRLDGVEKVPALSTTYDLPPGEHELEAIWESDQRVSKRAYVRSKETVEVKMEGPRPKPPSSSSMATWGFVTLGSGAAILVTAFVVDVAVLGPKFDAIERDVAVPGRDTSDQKRDAETWRAITWIGYGVGGITVLTGGALVLLAPKSKTGAEVHAFVDPSGVTLSGRF